MVAAMSADMSDSGAIEHLYFCVMRLDTPFAAPIQKCFFILELCSTARHTFVGPRWAGQAGQATWAAPAAWVADWHRVERNITEKSREQHTD